MRAHKKLVFAVASILWIAANIVWVGCVSAPITPSRKIAVYRYKADFDFVKPAKTTPLPTRDEVEQNIGKPDSFITTTRTAVYQMDVRQRREVFLLFFVIPMGTYEAQKSQLALIEYDEDSRVKRIEFKVR